MRTRIVAILCSLFALGALFALCAIKYELQWTLPGFALGAAGGLFGIVLIESAVYLTSTCNVQVTLRSALVLVVVWTFMLALFMSLHSSLSTAMIDTVVISTIPANLSLGKLERWIAGEHASRRSGA